MQTMSGVRVGDVVPSVGALADDVAGRLVPHGAHVPPLEELPADVLTREWLVDGRLVPPLTARLAAALLDDRGLSATAYVRLLPDLVRATGLVADSLPSSSASCERVAPAGWNLRWHAIDRKPAELELDIGRSAALEITAAAIREAATQSLGLSRLAAPRRRQRGLTPALATIADWAAGELALTTLGEALEAARKDAYAPPDVRQALAVVDGSDLVALTSGLEYRYDVFAAIRRVLAFSPRSLDVLKTRLYAGKRKRTLQELGLELNVTRERVRQIEGELKKQIEARLAASENAGVRRAAARLRDQVGGCRRLTDLPERAAWGLDLQEAPTPEQALHARFLMALAGPWHEHQQWLLHQSWADLPRRTQEELSERLKDGPIPEPEVLALLRAAGVPEADADVWLRLVCRCRVIDGLVVEWTGSMADKAAAILQMRGEPLSLEEIAEALGPDTNFRSMINQIQGDERFMRRGLKLYGLRRWGGEEYTTIKEEIEQEIEREGGAATLEHLISTLCSQFGVSEASVRAYSGDAPFIRTPDGRIAVGEGKARYERRAIEDCRGCFQLGPSWAWRVVVDGEIVRGSGRPVPTAMVQHLGIRPGEVRTMQTPVGEIALRYGRQATIGSLRRAAAHVGALEGDRLFVVLQSEASLEFRRVPQDSVGNASGLERLAREVGVEPDAGEDPVEVVARALGLPPDEYRLGAIRRRLRARREEELLDLLPDSTPAAVDHGLLDQLIGLGE